MSDTATAPPAAPRWRLSQTQWILVGMVVGPLVGWLFPAEARHLSVVANLFLRLVKCMVAPIVFSTLVAGIAEHGDDLRRLGRLAIRTMLYFEAVTAIALIVGLLVVNALRPGAGVRLPPAAEGLGELAKGPTSLAEIIEHTAPRSIVESAANNDVLQVVVFSAIFGVALARTRGPGRDALLNSIRGLAEAMFKFTSIIMLLAPAGVAAALAVAVARSGFAPLVALGKLVGTLYFALAIFLVGVLLPIGWLAGVPIRRFLRAVRKPALIGFSTTSSEAALPSAFEEMEALGIPRRIISFVLPAGYSWNLDGSTLYLAVASIFLAQAGGIHLAPGRQVFLLLTLLLTSKGVAAVPRASLVILSGTAASFGLPVEGIALILGADAIMDCGRTTVNLIGNCFASAVMARWEREW